MIAKAAGVAEGTIFTYLVSKDDLLKQLFLALKDDLRSHIESGYPTTGDVAAQLERIWERLVDWDVSDPARQKALSQLSVSEKLTDETRKAGNEM